MRGNGWWLWVLVVGVSTGGCTGLRWREGKPAGQPTGRTTPQQTIARLEHRLKTLKEQLAQRDRQIRLLREKLATATGLREYAGSAVLVKRVVIGRFSRLVDLDPARQGPEGVKVYLYLLDRDGDKIKRAGEVELKVFDLAGERKLGHWLFSPSQALEHWRSGPLLNCFVFVLPWQEEPAGRLDSAVLRWRFHALTGEVMSGEKVLKPSTAPAP